MRQNDLIRLGNEKSENKNAWNNEMNEREKCHTWTKLFLFFFSTFRFIHKLARQQSDKFSSTSTRRMFCSVELVSLDRNPLLCNFITPVKQQQSCLTANLLTISAQFNKNNNNNNNEMSSRKLWRTLNISLQSILTSTLIYKSWKRAQNQSSKSQHCPERSDEASALAAAPAWY